MPPSEDYTKYHCFAWTFVLFCIRGPLELPTHFSQLSVSKEGLDNNISYSAIFHWNHNMCCCMKLGMMLQSNDGENLFFINQQEMEVNQFVCAISFNLIFFLIDCSFSSWYHYNSQKKVSLANENSNGFLHIWMNL